MVDPIVLRVNGGEQRLDVDPEATLLEVLRDQLGLTGTKYGCGEGQCGACTVLLDGQEQRSCQLPAGAADGRAVRTIEGFADGERLHPLQQAFLDHGAMQCGYCTSGMIVAAAALLARNPAPDERAIRRALHGNLCRCGCYPRIVAAVQQCARTAGKGSGGGR
jgi:aerobic-type carbon monoxide dehydrogenase small subunit (CoxS/CutS family)